MEEVRSVEAEFSSIDADNEEQGLREPQESGQLLMSGRRHPCRVAAAAAAAAAAAPADPAEGAADLDDSGAAEDVSVRIARDRSMKQDWLHRGDREPLASMGLYHYAMFVYTTHLSASSVAADDFFTYRFAEGHPDASCRVQKLRVHELCRVPKVMGFTMPREDGASADRFRNTMFKSALFRPAYPVDGTSRKDELAAAMLSWVDSKGDYASEWKRWWDNQALLADRFEELQRRSQRVFSLADVGNAGYMQPLGDRKFPSPAEFMAHLTMEAATHLEIGAQSRAGRAVCPEFDSGDFGTDGGVGRGEGFLGAEDRDAPDTCEPPHAKQTQALHSIDSVDARAVALMQEFAPEPRSVSYFNDFDQVMGPCLREGIGGGHERAADSSGSFCWGGNLSFGEHEFDTCKGKQKEAFKYTRELDGAVPDTNEGEEGIVSNGFINWDPRSYPGLAELQDDDSPRAVEYVDAAIKRLGTGSRPVFLNQEQRDFLALVTAHIRDWEEYIAAKQRHDLEAVEPEPMRILLCGPGGAGKSELIKVVRGLCEFCFGEGSHKALAASNSAARAVGGDTVHSGLFLGGRNSFSLSEVSQRPTDECVDAWKDVHCLMLEEVSMIHPQMLAGMSYRLCKVRQKLHKWQSDPERYREPDHMFGRMPLVIMLGDFMQLAPIDRVYRRVSLIMPPKESWPEEFINGQRIFAESITHAVFLRETHRFKTWNSRLQAYEECPILPKLLEFMRNPEGREVPAEVASAFKQWEVKRLCDPRRSRREMLEGYEMAIGWHAVARMMQYRALREASAKKRILVYVQAIDTCSTQRLDASQYRKALQVVSMTDTGKLMGMCPLFVGMKVRLNAKLSAKHGLVHDAPGEVVGFQFDSREDLSWQQPGHGASKVGHVVLRYLPKAVFVKFKDVDVDSGFGHGVVAVEPCSSHWQFQTHEQLTGRRMPTKLGMNRRQIPLAPEKVRTVQTAQGLSMDACTMYLNKPATMAGDAGEDDYWIHLYVMLSRVRSSKNILAYSLPDIKFLGRGPPRWMKDGMAALEYVAYRSRDDVQDARHRLRWDARDFAEEPSEKLHFCCARWRERNRNLSMAQGKVRKPKASGKSDVAVVGKHKGVSACSRDRGEASMSKQELVVGTMKSTTRPGMHQGHAVGKTPAKDAIGSCIGRLDAPVQSEQDIKNRGRGPRDSTVETPGKSGPSSKLSRSTEAPVSAASLAGLQSDSRAQQPVGAEAGASTGDPPAEVSGRSSRSPGSMSSGHHVLSSTPRSYKALPHLKHSTARIPSSEPARYASLLRGFDAERAVMYYGLASSEFELVSVCTQVCRRGLPNGVLQNSCFINAALQCFLRLDIVAKILAAHKSRHGERVRRSSASCAACELAILAADMRSGTLCSASTLVRKVRSGEFGDDFKSVLVPSASGARIEHLQCDAPEFFLGSEELVGSRPEYQGLVGVLNRWEEEGFWGADAVMEARDANEVDQRRHVLDFQVFGFLTRTRKRCLLCDHVVDTLQEGCSLDLGFREGEDQSSCVVSLDSMVQRELGDVYVDPITKCDRRVSDGCRGEGAHGMILHRYVEREPPVLVIRLRRVWDDEFGTRKLHARCQFPEVLTFMRTGEYHFAGVILHIGPGRNSGHYQAVTWHGDDRYWQYDDDKSVKPLKWSELETASIQSQSYMLIYVRTRFWQGVAGDGSEVTPYAREPHSLSCLRGAGSSHHSSDHSVSVRASNPELSGVSRQLASVLDSVSPGAADEYADALSWTFEDIAEKFPAHSLFKEMSPKVAELLGLHVSLYASWAVQNSSLRPVQQLLCRMWQEEMYGLFCDLNASLRGGPCNESLSYLTCWLRCMVSSSSTVLEVAQTPFVWRATFLPAIPVPGDLISEPWLATTLDKRMAEERVLSFSSHPPTGLRAVLLKISVVGLRGMKLPAREVNEDEFLCLPGLALLVREVQQQVLGAKDVPVLLVELGPSAESLTSGAESHAEEPTCSGCSQLGAQCRQHSDVCMDMQLQHGCHACGRKDCWAKNHECVRAGRFGPLSTSVSLSGATGSSKSSSVSDGSHVLGRDIAASTPYVDSVGTAKRKMASVQPLKRTDSDTVTDPTRAIYHQMSARRPTAKSRAEPEPLVVAENEQHRGRQHEPLPSAPVHALNVSLAPSILRRSQRLRSSRAQEHARVLD